MKRGPQDDDILSAHLFMIPKEDVAPVLPVKIIVIGGIHVAEEGHHHLIPPHHLVPQTRMLVHKKLAPLQIPLKGEDIDVRIRLGSGHAASKSSRKEERT